MGLCAAGMIALSLWMLAIIVDMVRTYPEMRRQGQVFRAACESHHCPDGRLARLLAPRYESGIGPSHYFTAPQPTVCACVVELNAAPTPR